MSHASAPAPATTESRANLRRLDQHDLEQDLAVVAAPIGHAITDDDPRRCAAGGVGRFHRIEQDPDGVHRCAHCRQSATQIAVGFIVELKACRH